MDETDAAIEKAKRMVRAASTKEAKKIAARINQVLVLATPVDTGRARGNWLCGVNSPNTEARLEAKDKTGGAIIAENLTLISTIPDEVPVDIFLSNNLNYIIPLNNGHSAQAPAGFVEKALQTAKESL